jgi:mannose-1-phosphate guanylyltransferase/phosphomannomutase
MQGVSSIKGVIMSGGVGTRLRPLTCHLPKPMVPIFNKPVMEYGINLLKKYGINDIAVTLCYLPKIITDYFGDGSEFNVNINYYIEDRPLGTGGSVKNAHEFFDNTIVVISGDAFTNIDLGKAHNFHKEKGSKATLILSREPVPLEYGVVITDDNGKIIRFLEKPSWGEVFSDTINTGIYILEPEVLDYYKQGENFDFSKDLFPRLLRDNVPMYGYITEEYWCDVGDLNTYIETHVDVLSDEKKHYLLGKEQGKGIWIGEGTILEKVAKNIRRRKFSF